MPVTTSILERIDRLTSTQPVDHSTEDSLCACGCGELIEGMSPSGWWAGPDCMELWTATIDRPHLRESRLILWPRMWDAGNPVGYEWAEYFTSRGGVWFRSGEGLIHMLWIPDRSSLMVYISVPAGVRGDIAHDLLFRAMGRYRSGL